MASKDRPELNLKFPIVSAPPVQGAENEKPGVVSIPVVSAPPVQGAENEKEDDFTISMVELEETPLSEDEKDTAISIPIVSAPPVQGAENEKPGVVSIPVVSAPPVQGAENEPHKLIAHMFAEGQWLPSADPLSIGEANFAAMQNQRFGERCLEGVPGYTKINTAALSTYLKIRSGIQLRAPYTTKSRLLTQAYNTGLTASQILENKTAIPNQGAFEIAPLHTDAAGAGLGRFAKWPGNQIAYCNGVETMIYGGDEIPCAAFLNFDAANTFLYDFSEKVRNSDTGQVAMFTPDTAGGGISAGTKALYHLDNALTDGSGNSHTLTNAGGTFITAWTNNVAWWDGASSGGPKFGTHAIQLDGVNDLLYADHSDDFNFASGVWTIDFWAVFMECNVNPMYYQETPVTKIVFSSGKHEPAIGESVLQTTSGATGVVKSVTVDTGTWAGGDALGTIWLGAVTGVWANGNNTMKSINDLLGGDGDFTGGTTGWTLTGGWNYGTDNVDKVGDGTTTLSHDTLAAVVHEVYEVTYTISGLTAGSVTASFGGAAGTPRSADGTYTEILTAVSTAGLAFTPTNASRFTIDAISTISVIATCAICTTDTNYFLIEIDMEKGITFDTLCVKLRKYGVDATPITVLGINILSPIWQHLEFAENGDAWYIFVDGRLIATATSFERPEDYTSAEYFGYNNYADTHFTGIFDEIRASNVLIHSASFTPPAAPYETTTGSGSVGNVYIGSLRPAQAIKFYVQHANDTAAVAKGYYWDGAADVPVGSQVDGTAAAGKTLNVTGGASISFTSTMGLAKPRYLKGYFLYFYRFSFSGIAADTSVYQVTIDAPFQPVVDLWDGTPLLLSSCLRYVAASASYGDYTMEVAESSQSAFAVFDALATTEHILFGSPVPLAGFNVQVSTDPAKVNANPAAIAVAYCNGGAIASWPAVTGLSDETSAELTSFKQAGVVSFSPVAAGKEFKVSINGGAPQYYYKLSFNAALSATVEAYYITGITAPLTIKPCKFPFAFLGRPMLCGYLEGNEGNRVDYAMQGAPGVWNGPDASGGAENLPLYFGGNEDLTAACEVYNRLGSSIYSFAIFCKEYETYVLNGYDADTFRVYPISSVYGCPAPLTMDTYQVGISKDAQSVRSIAMWLSHSGPVMFDSGGLMPVPGLECYFDRRDSRCINSAAIENARGWFDPDTGDYHLAFPSGAGQITPNVWVAISVKYQKWYPVVPSAAVSPYPVAAIRVADTAGRQYVYGARDNGYMMRLHDPAVATWDGAASVQSVTLGDLFCSGNIWDVIRLLRLKVFGVSTTEDLDAAVTHYAGGAAAGTALSVVPLNATPRYFKNTQSLNLCAWSHQIKISVTVSTEVRGMRLLGWGMEFQIEREDI